MRMSCCHIRINSCIALAWKTKISLVLCHSNSWLSTTNNSNEIQQSPGALDMIIINLISQISDLHCHVLQHKSLMSAHKAKHQPASTTHQTKQAPRTVDPGHMDLSAQASGSRPRARNCDVASVSVVISSLYSYGKVRGTYSTFPPLENLFLLF